MYADKFIVQGVKINTPHYLAKLPTVSKGTSTYTVIVSQLDSLSTIHYTLRVRNCSFLMDMYADVCILQVYSTCPFDLSPVSNPYSNHKQVRDFIDFMLYSFYILYISAERRMACTENTCKLQNNNCWCNQ